MVFKINQFKDCACKCEECQLMCKFIPCLGTPEDIKKLIDAGYGNRLMVRQRNMWIREIGDVKEIHFLMPAIQGYEETTGPIIFPIGKCTFLSKKNLCILHDKDLKPKEGRWASHSKSSNKTKYDINQEIILLWRCACDLVEEWTKIHLKTKHITQ